MSGKNKQLFIPDNPTTDDYFKIHEKIAEQMSNFIEDLNEGTTIALKGKWGSGKSSIIEMLKEKSKNNSYKVFVFDVWAELGHNFRQAFLLNFLDWSAKEEILKKDNNSYMSKRLEILGKKKTIHREVSPTRRTALLHLFIFILMITIIPNMLVFFLSNLSGGIIKSLSLLSVLSFPLTILLVYYFISIENEVSKKLIKIFLRTIFIIWLFSYGVWLFFSIEYLVYVSFSLFLFWKTAFIIYFSFSIFVWLFAMFMKDSKDMIPIVSMYNGLLIGKIKDSEETKSLNDNSLDFRNEFVDILMKATKNYKGKIVIVIDNVDRIPEEKVDEVFAALKPFMVSDESEKDNVLKNVFYIIPFDPDGIRIGTDKGGYDYFNKLFKKEFYVPEPIYGNWQKYFEQISKEIGINIPTYLFEIAFQIVIGFKNYIEVKERDQNLKSKNTFEKDKNFEGNSEDEKSFSEIEKIFIPPTPREIKKFLNNYITIIQQYPEIKNLIKKEEKEVFPYILFAVLKTYGMINSSNELEKLFIEKSIENKSVFELYLTERGYNAYSFINSKELVYKIYALYYAKEPQVGFVVLQIPTLRKILSEPSYNKEFNLIISNIPDSFKNIFEDRLRDLIIGITDTIYSKEPQLIIGIGIYLKELKKHFNGVYESIKDKLFDVLKSNVANTESFISNLDEKILDDKTSNLLNVIESVLFIQKEANFDLINQMLEFSRYKVEILKSLIENKNKIDLDIEMLRETFYDLERDAQYLIELLDYIGKTFDKKTDELIKSIISKCIVVTDNMIDKCLKIFSNKINKDPTNDDYFSQIIDFLKSLGRILLFGKFAEQKGKIQTLVLNKFSSIFLSKILSVNNFSRDFIYIRFLLTFYSYFYSLETANEIRKLINSINNYQRIISNLPKDQNKVLPSSLATLFLVYNDIKNININFLNSIFSSADIEGIFDFIKEKEYEMEEFFKKEEIFETYSYLIENVSSQKNKITNLYRNIYEYLLEIEEYDLSWVFNLYKLLKDLEVSLEKIKNCVKRLSSKFSFDNVRIDKHSIELLNYLFGIRNEEKLIEEFEKIINKEIDKNIREELFTQPVFYECCANYQVKLIGNLHKNVFKAILDNLENFSKDNIEKIADFLIIQSNSFIKDFIEDFKQSIKTKAHSTDNIEQSEKEIDFIFEKFNFIFEKLVQNKREILEKAIDDEFIRTLENLSTVPENVERFLKMVKE